MLTNDQLRAMVLAGEHRSTVGACVSAELLKAREAIEGSWYVVNTRTWISETRRV